MKNRFRMFRRKNGVFYLQDNLTAKQESLKTRSKAVAEQLHAARNQAASQPYLNVSMAKTYLSASSPEMVTRTWNDVMEDMAIQYKGATLRRWKKVIISPPFLPLKNIPLVYTDSSHLLAVLRHPRAGVSTNVWLRILHNRALGLGWLLNPVLAKRAWPKIVYKQKRGITADEHQRIIDSETNVEYRLYYELLWETGGSQTDIACLHRDNVDLEQKLLMYQRRKLEGQRVAGATLVIGPRLQAVLDQLPQTGWLFPILHLQEEMVRASRFRKRCLVLGLKGISLHSYRYAWAERACNAGMPEREAMAHLGHNSNAVHRAYARRARNVTLPLEYYEAKREGKIVEFKATSQTQQISSL